MTHSTFQDGTERTGLKETKTTKKIVGASPSLTLRTQQYVQPDQSCRQRDSVNPISPSKSALAVSILLYCQYSEPHDYKCEQLGLASVNLFQQGRKEKKINLVHWVCWTIRKSLRHVSCSHLQSIALIPIYLMVKWDDF